MKTKKTMRQDLIRVLTIIKDDAPITFNGIAIPVEITKSDSQQWTGTEIKLISSLVEAKMITGRILSVNSQTQAPAGYHGLRITFQGNQLLEKQQEDERKSQFSYTAVESLKAIIWIVVGAVITCFVDFYFSKCGLTPP